MHDMTTPTELEVWLEAKGIRADENHFHQFYMQFKDRPKDALYALKTLDENHFLSRHLVS